MDITVSNKQKKMDIKTAGIKASARKILNALEFPEAELSVMITDDDGIQELNRDYLNRDRPTNVISFPMQEGDYGDVNPNVLGDVVLSVETVARDAEALGYDLLEMLDFYLIHGILHLIGYDHEGAADEAAQMEAKTRELFEALGHRLQ